MKNKYYYAAVALFIMGCQQPAPKAAQTPATGTTPTTAPALQRPTYTAIQTTYHLVSAKDSIKNFKKYYTDAQLPILFAVNRVDSEHMATLTSIVVPDKMDGNVMAYSVFPQRAPFLQQVNKIIFFSYPAQYFGAYEHGQLVYSGPTNMGRQKDPTPTGLFYTNWKAEETKSTFNDEWDLKWNFNIENKLGVGFHQYALPGYPASHSCLRLQESDAKLLYSWADEWVLRGKEDIKQYGTPVVVFGTYPFGSAKPWLQLVSNAHALDIGVADLQTQANSYMSDIMAKQGMRDSVKAK